MVPRVVSKSLSAVRKKHDAMYPPNISIKGYRREREVDYLPAVSG